MPFYSSHNHIPSARMQFLLGSMERSFCDCVGMGLVCQGPVCIGLTVENNFVSIRVESGLLT